MIHIGVILHPEIDHKPHCYISGLCKKRLKILELGAFMVRLLFISRKIVKECVNDIYRLDLH